VFHSNLYFICYAIKLPKGFFSFLLRVIEKSKNNWEWVLVMVKKAFKRKTNEEKMDQVQQLLNKLEDGVKNFVYDPERFKAVLIMQSLMPNYSFNNIMLIRAQMKSANYVASFKRWKELGRHVLKGQSSIKIMAPRFKKEENKITGQSESKLCGFMAVPVFDVSQTDGEPLPIDKADLTLPGESDEAIRIFAWTKLLAEEDDCRISIAHANGARGYYSRNTHEIVIDSSLSVNHAAKTAVHELVHSRVHRINNDETSSELECVAEGTAFIICSYFGLDTSDYSFEYVRGWSEDDGESLIRYGELIQKTANKLINEYERVSLAITMPAESSEEETEKKIA